VRTKNQEQPVLRIGEKNSSEMARKGLFPLLAFYSLNHSESPVNGALTIQTDLPALGGSPSQEIWYAGEVSRRSESHGFQIAETSTWTVGTLVIEGGSLGENTRKAYAALTAFLTDKRQHPVRLWNTIPQIHHKSGELNRYMRFCQERGPILDRYLKSGFGGSLCAATAVGSERNRQILSFVAFHKAGQTCENHRQVNAYEYPKEHGPTSPTFARAMRVPGPKDDLLFISGTASIVGHRSQHPGHVVNQTAETIRNLRVLLGPYTPVSLRIYLRRPKDLKSIQDAVQTAFGTKILTLYIQADICRRELLVEIEAVAEYPRTNSPNA
jgi:chorismate lyase/3-hydroxybenzoate synthase